MAEALLYNTTLTSLNLSCNKLGTGAGKALVEALHHNVTLTTLWLYGGIPKHFRTEIEKLMQARRQRPQREEPLKRKREAEKGHGESVGTAWAALQAVRLSRSSSLSGYAQQVLQHVLKFAAGMDSPGCIRTARTGYIKPERKKRRKTEKEKEKEKEGNDGLLRSAEEALRRFQVWQARHAARQKELGEETERRAKRIGEALQRLGSAFSGCSPEEEQLLEDNHAAALVEAIHNEQDFLRRGLDGVSAHELYQGIGDLIAGLQLVCEELQEQSVTMKGLLWEKMQAERILAHPLDYQQLSDLQRACKEAWKKVRYAQAGVDGAAEGKEERAKTEDILAKVTKQLNQQATLLESKVLQFVSLSNSSHPELRFILRELRLEALDLIAVDRRLDHYDHIQVLSSAGRHRVLKAQFQGEPCMLKEFDLNVDHSLFMMELKRLASLQHEHIVKVEAAFVQSSNGGTRGYIHMLFYSGGNLCEWLKNGREGDRSDAEKQRAGRGVLLALQHIHSQGVVHRDVKPQSIFIESYAQEVKEGEGDEGQGHQQALLGDFDISSKAGTALTEAMTMTDSLRGGTRQCMAPEVCNGEVGPAADVFAWGLLMFDLHFAVPALRAQAEAPTWIAQSTIATTPHHLLPSSAHITRSLTQTAEGSPQLRSDLKQLYLGKVRSMQKYQKPLMAILHRIETLTEGIATRATDPVNANNQCALKNFQQTMAYVLWLLQHPSAGTDYLEQYNTLVITERFLKHWMNQLQRNPSVSSYAATRQERGEGGREVRPARPTLMEMVKGQEITIPPHPNPHLRDLLHQVLQLDARKRPTASQCLSHPFLWTHLVEHRVAERDRRRCVVCMDEKWLDEGLQCLPPPSSSPQPHGQRPDKGETERHFVCGGCLNGWAVSLLDMPAAVLAERARHVPCLVNGCAAQPFPMEQLMAHVEDEGRKALLEVRSKATEFLSEQAFQQRLEHEREQWEKQSTVQRHGRRMVEDILTLQCPRCHQAFVDFDGCFALTCSRCNAAFCAWCLQDCGRDAHRHVVGCAHNLAGGNVFGSVEEFEEGQRRRRERKVREYLNGLEREEREQVAAALKKELEDLNIRL
ncbi:non-specific serine/threonine protein kinase [Balamuthia mandrillaris]